MRQRSQKLDSSAITTIVEDLRQQFPRSRNLNNGTEIFFGQIVPFERSVDNAFVSASPHFGFVTDSASLLELGLIFSEEQHCVCEAYFAIVGPVRVDRRSLCTVGTTFYSRQEVQDIGLELLRRFGTLFF